ncbi:hypothetical protein J8273_7703 [Carpediemonas membranifera]|uniref:Uncharacterized protein n=1 Tax=Carpediemonas membranifera TaxID=201153 RepID=A0A8J6DXL0_9EUKA|nr:hypothetical protein J8273_7703 [Carpediemonas membranifera]|eukprot:KAG9390354.1 hypothetical protein J8273_7703 [Carpediemonas membranifera]
MGKAVPTSIENHIHATLSTQIIDTCVVHNHVGDEFITALSPKAVHIYSIRQGCLNQLAVHKHGIRDPRAVRALNSGRLLAIHERKNVKVLSVVFSTSEPDKCTMNPIRFRSSLPDVTAISTGIAGTLHFGTNVTIARVGVNDLVPTLLHDLSTMVKSRPASIVDVASAGRAVIATLQSPADRRIVIIQPGKSAQALPVDRLALLCGGHIVAAARGQTITTRLVETMQPLAKYTHAGPIETMAPVPFGLVVSSGTSVTILSHALVPLATLTLPFHCPKVQFCGNSVLFYNMRLVYMVPMYTIIGPLMVSPSSVSFSAGPTFHSEVVFEAEVSLYHATQDPTTHTITALSHYGTHTRNPRAVWSTTPDRAFWATRVGNRALMLRLRSVSEATETVSRAEATVGPQAGSGLTVALMDATGVTLGVDTLPPFCFPTTIVATSDDLVAWAVYSTYLQAYSIILYQIESETISTIFAYQLKSIHQLESIAVLGATNPTVIAHTQSGTVIAVCANLAQPTILASSVTELVFIPAKSIRQLGIPAHAVVLSRHRYDKRPDTLSMLIPIAEDGSLPDPESLIDSSDLALCYPIIDPACPLVGPIFSPGTLPKMVAAHSDSIVQFEPVSLGDMIIANVIRNRSTDELVKMTECAVAKPVANSFVSACSRLFVSVFADYLTGPFASKITDSFWSIFDAISSVSLQSLLISYIFKGLEDVQWAKAVSALSTARSLPDTVRSLIVQQPTESSQLVRVLVNLSAQGMVETGRSFWAGFLDALISSQSPDLDSITGFLGEVCGLEWVERRLLAAS